MSAEELARKPKDLIDAFLARASDHAPVVAVESAQRAISYDELRSTALQIAASIGHAMSAPCPRVLIALRPSERAYAAMIGVLMVGGTFCPVDTFGPEGRNRAVCEAFAPDVVLYEEVAPSFISALPVTTPRVDISQPLPSEITDLAKERSDVAYVVFTSGSMGLPKGVKLGREAFSYFLGVCQPHFNLFAGEKWGQFSSLAHDLGVMDVFMALTQGGTLVPLDEAERRLRPAAAIRDKKISVWQSVPSVLDLMLRGKQLTSEYLSGLRVMSFCGEPLRREQLEALFKAHPGLTVFNTYGATETIGFNTLNELRRDTFVSSCDGNSAAIGEDVPGWSLHLRGGHDENEGEIVVASEFLSLGYWCDEERTRSSFRQVDLGGSRSERCYFTGDLGVRRGGRLYCAGRMDRQVKIRGERVELEEIDGLLRSAGFPAAYTICKDGELYSFVESTQSLDQEQIRGRLQESLPFHAIPRTIYALASLSRNQSGKVDREALYREIER